MNRTIKLLFQNNELPSKFTNQEIYSTKNKTISYQGKNIGKVFVYYKENRFNNLNLTEEEIAWLKNHTSIRVHAEENGSHLTLLKETK